MSIISNFCNLQNEKNKIIYLRVLVLGLVAFFVSGCVYLTHLDEAMFIKSLDNSQKEMQAQLDKEGKLFNKLKADLESGRISKLTEKARIFKLYGEPVLCAPVKGQGQIKETCVYRKPVGGIILLNLDTQGRLISWQI